MLDIMLPKLSGLEVCKTLRGEGFEAPIVMLTARGQEIDKVVGLELGADDYVTKPFSIRELLARVRAILRRSEGKKKRLSRYQLLGRRAGLRGLPGEEGRGGARASAPRVRAAALPDRAQGGDGLARPAARGRLGLRELSLDAHRGHPHREAARQDRRQRLRAALHPDHPRHGLQVHRSMTCAGRSPAHLLLFRCLVAPARSSSVAPAVPACSFRSVARPSAPFFPALERSDSGHNGSHCCADLSRVSPSRLDG